MATSLEAISDLHASADVEPFAIPAVLQSHEAATMLPAIGPGDLHSIRQAGWSRFGIVAAVADDRGRLLMLTHAQGDKTKAGSLGPLAETSHFSNEDGTPHVESTTQTLARSIREELGLPNAASLGLTARPTGAWALSKWPVGGTYEQQYALAVCPVLHIGQVGCEMLVDGFEPTEEIEAIQFMSPDEITAARNLRDGTLGWLGDVAASGLLTMPGPELVLVDLAVPGLTGNGQDVRFDRITV